MTGTTDLGPRGTALLRRLEELEHGLARGGGRVPHEVAAEVRRRLDAVGQRLARGVDHTVVALVGGTGSGKSSLFNALSGLRFADVGARRPTTSAVSACTWGRADALLDWLGVATDRRIERESELDGDTQADLRGLVLLDLPDHDSVAPEHREVVDRLLPMVDLLVWVVDPQKYADDALHSGYLQRLTGHEASMAVVLNQVDTVPVSAHGSLLRDVDRLLRRDGLEGVPVHAVSARTGDGVPVLRGALAAAVAGRGAAEIAAAAELEDAARALGGTVGDLEPRNVPRDTTVEDLLAAAGVPAVVDGLRRGERPHPEPPQADRVAQVRTRWLETVTPGLPDPWTNAVTGEIGPVDEVREGVGRRLDAVPVPEADVRRADARRRLAGALLVAAGVAVAAAVVLGLVGVPPVATGAAAALAVVALLGAVTARSAAARARSAAWESAASAYVLAARAEVGTVVDELLVAPTRRVLADHRTVRVAARGSGTGADGAAALGAAPAEHAPSSSTGHPGPSPSAD